MISADSILSYFIFFFIFNFIFNEYTFRLCIFSSCSHLRLLFHSRLFNCIQIMILVPYVFLIIACVWKLEIKVLLYLPVSQPPTVTMVLVSIKKNSNSIGLCCVATLFYTPLYVHARCNITSKSLQLGRTDWNNARATKLNLDKSEIQ